MPFLDSSDKIIHDPGLNENPEYLYALLTLDRKTNKGGIFASSFPFIFTKKEILEQMIDKALPKEIINYAKNKNYELVICKFQKIEEIRKL